MLVVVVVVVVRGVTGRNVTIAQSVSSQQQPMRVGLSSGVGIRRSWRGTDVNAYFPQQQLQ